MGDAGEGLIDQDSRIQERMEELERERAKAQMRDVRDPETVRTLESLKVELERRDDRASLATTGRRRFAALLLRAAEGDEVKGLSHQDIAERLGVYRETVTNALNELKNANILNVGRKHITIVDRKRLERAASE